MTMPTPLPFGLRDVKLRPISSAGVVGTSVDLPASRTFSFTETEDFETLRGDDTDVAARGTGPGVDWELEAGGISLEAYAIIAGGTVTTTGTTPNRKKTYRKLTTDARPYFQVEGQAMSDSGGDFHAIVYKAKATGDLEGELSDGSFWLTSASGRGFPGPGNEAYDFVQNESVTPIT